MKNKKWSEKDIEYLCVEYQNKSVDKLASDLDRSVHAIYHVMKRLGKSKHKSLLERFLDKVDKHQKNYGCWIWVGAKNKKGYGKMAVNRKPKYAHRVSWELFNNKIPKNMQILHKCDNPSCVNPDHLFVGTHQDNMDDKVKKGLALSGENHPNSKLTVQDVKEIRLLNGTMKYADIGHLYNISSTQVYNIINNKQWVNF